jgi:hypothetical protein
MARPKANAPSPITTSSSKGAPVEAKDEALDAAVATVGAPSERFDTGDGVDTSDAGIGVTPEADDAGVPAAGVEPTVDAAVVGCGHEASALPLSAA